MANLAKKDYDTRTFVQICASLPREQWLAIRDRIITKTGCSKQTIINWKRGVTIPASKLERVEISRTVNRFLGIETIHTTLFPEN